MKPRFPFIGVTMSIAADAVPERAHVNAAYIRAVQEAGGVPVLLPPHLEPWAREALRDRLGGLLLTGGGDVDPARFGETRHPKTSEVSVARDELEIELTTAAIDRGLPVLAVCRGVQVLNVALGGSLVQDLPSEVSGALQHAQTAPRHQPTHHVRVTEGTRLAELLGRTEVSVNSFHHQGLKALGRGLKAVAWAPDGTVEGLEMPDAPNLVVGVQWHPEELTGHDPTARALFAGLVDAARSTSGQ